MTLTIAERVRAYNRTMGKRFPASRLHVVQEAGGPVVYGTWLLGNNYRNRSRLYGAYPPGYLPRLAALFPDAPTSDASTLHVFAGSLPADRRYVRLDLQHDDRRQPDVQGSVYDVARLLGYLDPFWLIYADPPYSDRDAIHYGTPMVDRRRAMAALGAVARPGGFVVWLDTEWPMHRKADWRTAGRITLLEAEPDDDDQWTPERDWRPAGLISLVRSTNHRVRLISLFERRQAAAEVAA